ncbi:sulfotransferase family protein [Pseudomonas tohonis]|nr:hypothetical protein L682_25350 [Pseudomonas alcaligenes OT 69]MDN4144710.1 sulfotransferase family protein [Pseudomonas tohonis]
MTPLDFTEWLPIRAFEQAGSWQLDWAWFGTAPLARPFFSDDVDDALRLPFNLALRRQTGLDALFDWQARSPGLEPSLLVFHTSRCGSTLLAQLLRALPGHVVLSEPPPLDALLRVHYRDPTASAWQADAVRALFSAYGQRRCGDETRLVVKLDAWNLFEAQLLRRLYPEVPCLFLYRDPLEVVVSQRRQPGLHAVPGLLGPSGLDGLPGREAVAPGDYLAWMVGHLLQAGFGLCAAGEAVALNYRELPDALWGHLGPLLGIDPAAVPHLQAVAGRDAKRPGQAFSADGEAKRNEADEATRAAVERWARAPYQALEALPPPPLVNDASHSLPKPPNGDFSMVAN